MNEPGPKTILLFMEPHGDQSPWTIHRHQEDAPPVIHNALHQAGFEITDVSNLDAFVTSLRAIQDGIPISAIIFYSQFAGELDAQGDALRKQLIETAVEDGKGTPVIYVNVPFAQKTQIDGATAAVEYEGDATYHNLVGPYVVDVLNAVIQA